MSLWFRLNVNTEGIGTFEARRIEHRDLPTTPDDVVSTYEIRIDGQLRGTVRHRYGDGPWVLIKLGLELAPIGVSKSLAGVRPTV